MTPAVWAHILSTRKSQWDYQKAKRVSPQCPLEPSFDLKFCSWISLIILRISWKFQLKRMFLCRDIELLKNNCLSQTRHKSQFHWKLNISTKEHSFKLKLSGYSQDDYTYPWAKFPVKTPLFGFLLDIDKMVKNSVKRP
jgi:hypothetical protein